MLVSRQARLTAAVAAALALPAAAQAANIGMDWFGGSGGATPNDQTQMLPTDVAGVVPHGNWNSYLGDPSGSQPLNLSTGAPSGATVTWANSPNDWDTNINETTSGDHKMMLGYLDTNDTSVTNVTVNGLPASVTAGGYNVYVYYDGDNGTSHRVGRYAVNGVSQWGRDAGTTFSGTYTLGQTNVDPTIASGGVIDTVPQAVLDTVPAGNYMIFGPFTDPNFTLDVQASVSASGTNRGPLNGFQIVQIPEPTALGLVGLGALGLLSRRRRRA